MQSDAVDFAKAARKQPNARRVSQQAEGIVTIELSFAPVETLVHPPNVVGTLRVP